MYLIESRQTTDSGWGVQMTAEQYHEWETEMTFSKESVYIAGDPGSIPGSGRSPGKGNGNLLQYSCLKNPMDRGAWQATVCRVTKRVGHDWRAHHLVAQTSKYQ